MLVVLMAACQKDEFGRIPEGALRLTAENFQSNGTKTLVNGTSVMWKNGDSVRFDVTDSTFVESPVTVADGHAYVTSVPVVNPLYAYCPNTLGVSTFRSDNAVITMPAEYPSSFDANGNQVINLPMVAKVTDDNPTSIEFKHLTAAVKVTVRNLSGANLTLDSVVVNSNSLQLCGTRNVTIGVGSVSVGAQESSSPNDRRVKVTFSGSPAIASTETREVQVPFWPVAATTGEGDFTINVYAHDGTNKKYVYCKNGTSPVLDRNQLLSANVSMGDNVVDLDRASGDIVVTDGKILTGTLNSLHKVSIAADATVTLDNMTINGGDYDNISWAGLTCLGNATLVLSGNNNVNSFSDGHPGIFVPDGSTLTIKGNGALTSTSNGSGAGIGSSRNSASGNIVIQSGTVTAIGASGTSYGAGIGSCGGPCGNITIQGGTVTATGGNHAAGIGTGDAYCASISITGGTVNATGGGSGAGIGSSCGSGSGGGYDQIECGNINISGGNVTATGGSDAAGIGTGYGAPNRCYNINISGGTIVAIGNGNSAGIGTSAQSNSSCGNITITTGVTCLTATKGSNTALNNIGRGHASSTCGTVTIGGTVYYLDGSYQNSGDVFLTCENYVYPANKTNLGNLTGDYTAHDGEILTGTVSGSYLVTIPHNTTVVLDNVTIDHSNHSGLPGLFCNGTIILVGTNTVKGSGGKAGVLVQGNGNLTIKGTGTLNAHGGYNSAGIGGQYLNVFGDITIESGSVNAYGGEGGAGIGAGYAGNGGDINITGGYVYAVGGEGWTCGIGCSGKPRGKSASQVDNIYISGGTVTAKGDMAPGISNIYFPGLLHRSGDIYLVGDCNVYAEGGREAIANYRQGGDIGGSFGRLIIIATSGCVYAFRFNTEDNNQYDTNTEYPSAPICIYGRNGTSIPLIVLEIFNRDDTQLWYKNGPNCPWNNNGK